MRRLPEHQYIQRHSGTVVTENLLSDRLVNLVYSRGREIAPRLFRQLTSRRSNDLWAYLNYDLTAGNPRRAARRVIRSLGIDLSECVDADNLATPRQVFERQIRYWACRPMAAAEDKVVSPADARMVFGSLARQSLFFIKEKFFGFEELLGEGKAVWLRAFEEGQFAIFRLTPEKYHYNHLPVSGIVRDVYSIEGAFHSCNPGAVVRMVQPYSKNRRVVTIVDTDVPDGSCVGLVAMIEIVALMIGDIVQCYSPRRYQAPRSLAPGDFVRRGQPKSLYRPGSSVDVLLFQKRRIRFCDDLKRNLHHPKARSRFSEGFGRRLVETDVAVRSTIAHKEYYHDG
ncbi:MAG: phosphatidylserine decarboxylase [Desulfobacterales bacterium]|nr:phosphatidylserine decarboxylase [Desulfobacterales bacterium]